MPARRTGAVASASLLLAGAAVFRPACTGSVLASPLTAGG